MAEGNEHLKTLAQAFRHAAKMRKDVKSGINEAGTEEIDDVRPDDAALVSDFFKHERSGIPYTNYPQFALTLWTTVLDQASDDPEYQDFQQRLIRAALDVDTGAFMYADAQQALPALLEKYGDMVEKFGLWSKGDVFLTGFQMQKIVKSRILHKVFGHYKGIQGGRTLLKEKAFFVVDEDKHLQAREMLEERIRREPEKMLKVVVIDDVQENLEAFGELTADLSSDKGTAIEFVPILVDRNPRPNGKPSDMLTIRSFSELLDADMESLFAGATVFVDYDGVLSNNELQTKAHTELVFRTLVNFVSQKNNLDSSRSAEIVRQRISTALGKVPDNRE